jgi:hypothetical protein
MSPTYDFGTSADMNVTMTKSALAALSAVAPGIKHFAFQSGSIVSSQNPNLVFIHPLR